VSFSNSVHVMQTQYTDRFAGMDFAINTNRPLLGILQPT
jgi:hypothetical protein